MMITDIRIAILNALADDSEDLERIYKSICLEFCAERYDPSDPTSLYWREIKGGPSLSEIADNLLILANMDLVKVRMPESITSTTIMDNSSYVWKGWFELTEKGREVLLNWAQSERM